MSGNDWWFGSSTSGHRCGEKPTISRREWPDTDPFVNATCVRATVQFERDEKRADLDAVMREIDDARLEEAARIARMAETE